MNLQKRVLAILLGLTIAQGAILLAFTFIYLEDILEDQIGQRALNVAESISQIKEISDAVKNKDTQYLQTLSLNIADNIGARFVVIGDKQSIRLSHPVAERIGKPMQGGDNELALLHGQSYISKAVGSLGPSMRGKAPIRDIQGNIVGLISVGYMLDSVSKTVKSYQNKALIYLTVVVLSTALIAFYISSQIKKSIHGFEPEEIARLFAEQSYTLEAIKEGIISIDKTGQITNINKSALDFLGLESFEKIKSRYLADIIPSDEILQIANSYQPIQDREFLINNQLVIMNLSPVFIDKELSGAVISFRLKDELEKLSEKLSNVEQQADMLRSQAHEYSNRLQTVSGLIALNETEKAIEVIGHEHFRQQELITFLMGSIQSSVLSGLIIGKYNRAKELGITLEIDSGSEIAEIPLSVNRDRLITILGNLLDNAIEASLKFTGKGAKVKFSAMDLGNDLVFEIEDQGPGIPEQDINNIFVKGISSKEKLTHGYGLWLVKEQLELSHGYLTIDQIKPNGSLFTVFIPKQTSSKENEHTG